MGDDLDAVLSYVRAQLTALVDAWSAAGAPPSGTPPPAGKGVPRGQGVHSLDAFARGMGDGAGGEATGEGTDGVVDLADPLYRLSGLPKFREAFRAHFRDTFDVAGALPGVERLCEQLAPACTWSMLYLISTLGSSANARYEEVVPG